MPPRASIRVRVLVMQKRADYSSFLKHGQIEFVRLLCPSVYNILNINHLESTGQFVRVLKMSYNLLFSALPAPVPLYLLMVALKL